MKNMAVLIQKNKNSLDIRSKCKPSYPARQDTARPLHHPEYVPSLTRPIPPSSKSIGVIKK